jgi:hypothetical protein
MAILPLIARFLARLYNSDGAAPHHYGPVPFL